MLPFKLPTFFKNKGPKQFLYEPRYYNEQKEKMEERYARISKEINITNESNSGKSNYHTSLHQNWLSSSRNSRKTYSANSRVLLYFLVLVGLVYYFFS